MPRKKTENESADGMPVVKSKSKPSDPETLKRQTHRGFRQIVCCGCNETKIHHAKGYCRSCYGKLVEKYNPRTKEYERQRYSKRREQILKRVSLWQKENPDRTRENKRRHYYKDIEKTRKYNREWSRAYNATINGKLKMRERNFSNRHRSSDVVFLSDLSGVLSANTKKFGAYFCERCGIFLGKIDDFNGTIDHIKPLSAGGNSGHDNLQVLCNSCNSKKHTKTYDYRLTNAWLS